MHASVRHRIMVFGSMLGILIGILFIAYCLILTNVARALTSTTLLYPDGDSFADGTRWSGVGGSGCSQMYCRINDVVDSTAEYVEHAVTNNANNSQYFTLTNPAYVGQGATEFRLIFHASVGPYTDIFDSANDAMLSRAQYDMTAFQNGVDIFSPIGASRTNQFATNNYVYQQFQQAQSGLWTKSQLDSAQIGFNRLRQGSTLSSQVQRISSAKVQVTYTQPPAWQQQNYRVYQASSSTTPGPALTASQNTPAELPSQGSAFRIRMGLNANSTEWNSNFGMYKLQYATKSSSCAASSFTDVLSGSGSIRWYDDTPADGAAISAHEFDPSGTKTYQAYRESNSFTNGNTVPVNNLSLWDFSLKDFSNSPGTSYCFRLVKSDQVAGYESITYSQYPEVRVVGTLSIDFVNYEQTPISPTFPFQSKLMQSSCQTSQSQEPGDGAYMRITNDISTSGWSASLAPTDGPSALWYDSSGDNYLDFNDPAGSPSGCYPGNDGDTYAGQLNVHASSIYVAGSNCSHTGLSVGADSAFHEGVVNNITLISADSSSSRFCLWYAGGLKMTQLIPPLTRTGEYKLDMTLTVTAS